MILSVKKLNELLLKRGFVTNKYFTIDDLCMYIELIEISTTNIFLLYIPSKYKFEMKGKKDVFKLKLVDLAKDTDVIDRYTKGDNNPQTVYGDMNIELNSDSNKQIENYLEDKYNKPIVIDGPLSMNDLKAIHRQVKRLSFAVNNLKYKIGIIYKQSMCVIRRNNDVELYMIKNFSSPTQQLMIIVDLEQVYGSSNISEDIVSVKNGICNILEQSQIRHSDLLNRMIVTNDSLFRLSGNSSVKQSTYEDNIKKFEGILQNIHNTEKYLTSELDFLNSLSHLDQTQLHKKNQHIRELDELMNNKEQAINSLVDIRNKKESNSLTVDKIMFDNIVMFDAIIKNLNSLNDILK